MSRPYELLMSLSDSEFDELRKVRDTEGYDKAVEFVTPKFSTEANDVVNELDRIDNFAKPKKDKEIEETEEEESIEESGLEDGTVGPALINIAEEGKEAEFVPNPQLPPTVGSAPIINEKILQDPTLKANDIQDGMQAGQATGAQVAMNRINDMKIQQFSALPKLNYTEALDLVRESYLKDLEKDVFDEMISAYQSKPESSDGSTEVTSVLNKYELSLDGVDGIVDILSKMKEESDNFTSKGRKVVLINNKENFNMSRGKRVVLINFDTEHAISGAGTGALIGAGAGFIAPELKTAGFTVWNKGQAWKAASQAKNDLIEKAMKKNGGKELGQKAMEGIEKQAQQVGDETFKQLQNESFKKAGKFTPKAATMGRTLKGAITKGAKGLVTRLGPAAIGAAGLGTAGALVGAFRSSKD